MKSFRERQELKKYGGALISFAPKPGMKFGLSDQRIQSQCITAKVEAGDAGRRVTAARAATLGVFALAAKKKRPNTVALVLTGNDYAEVVECSDRLSAEKFAARVNTISA